MNKLHTVIPNLLVLKQLDVDVQLGLAKQFIYVQILPLISFKLNLRCPNIPRG